MRCKSCNIALSDAESTRKDPTGEYYDLCSQCFWVSESLLTEDNYVLPGPSWVPTQKYPEEET